MTIGALTSGVAPMAIEPAAAAAAGELTTVEASSVNLVSGEARVTVRFTAEDDEIAHQVASHVLNVTSSMAAIPGWQVTRRVGSRWNRIG